MKVEFFNSIEKSSLKKQSKFRWPKYNNDGLFFTPAFIIPEDLGYLSLLRESLKTDHMNKIKEFAELGTNDTQLSFLRAEPREHQRCGVCKITYECFQEVDYVLFSTSILKLIRKIAKNLDLLNIFMNFVINYFQKINQNK